MKLTENTFPRVAIGLESASSFDRCLMAARGNKERTSMKGEHIVIEVSGGVVTSVYSDHLMGDVIIVDLDAEEVGEPVTAQFCRVERLWQAAQQTKHALKEVLCA